jgi:hypothetical protein
LRTVRRREGSTYHSSHVVGRDSNVIVEESWTDEGGRTLRPGAGARVSVLVGVDYLTPVVLGSEMLANPATVPPTSV